MSLICTPCKVPGHRPEDCVDEQWSRAARQHDDLPPCYYGSCACQHRTPASIRPEPAKHSGE